MSKEAMKLALDALEALVERATPWDGLAWVNGREAITALKALAEQPAQQGIEMVDDEGENRAVRAFLALYGGAAAVTVEHMRRHLKSAGFDGAWPDWANNHAGHLTKAGAQIWIRHLFALAEQPAQQEPVAYFNPQVKGGFYWAKPTKITAPVTVSVEPMPLYTTPQAQRKPLTDEEIKKLAAPLFMTHYWGRCNEFARAIEAAHGIKENT